MPISLLMGVILARGLGAANFGIYGSIISISAIASVFIEFGIPQLTVRTVAIYNSLNEGLFSYFSWILDRLKVIFIIHLLAVSLLIGVFLFYKEAFPKYYLMCMLLAPVMAVLNIQLSYLRGVGKLEKSQLLEIIVRPLAYLFFLVMAYYFANGDIPLFVSLVGLVFVYFALCIFIAMVFMSFDLKEFFQYRNNFSRSNSALWSKDANKIFFGSLIFTLQGHLTIIFMPLFTAASEAGIYRVANSLIFLVGLPLSVIAAVALPILAKLSGNKSHKEFNMEMKRFSQMLFYGTLIIGFVLFFLCDYVVVLVFGVQYTGAVFPLKILIIGSVVSSAFGIGSTALSASGRDDKVLNGMLKSILVIVIFAPPLVFFHGAVGAALATSLMMIISSFIFFEYCGSELEVNSAIGFE